MWVILLAMNKSLTFGLVVLINLSLEGCSPITSQNTDTEPERCNKAIAEVEQQLQTVHQTTIELSQINIKLSHLVTEATCLVG